MTQSIYAVGQRWQTEGDEVATITHIQKTYGERYPLWGLIEGKRGARAARWTADGKGEAAADNLTTPPTHRPFADDELLDFVRPGRLLVSRRDRRRIVSVTETNGTLGTVTLGMYPPSTVDAGDLFRDWLFDGDGGRIGLPLK